MPPRKTDRPPDCHPERPYHAKGLCKACYKKEWDRHHPPRRKQAHIARHRTKVNLLCAAIGIKPRHQSLVRLLGNPDTLRQLHLAYKRGDDAMVAVWPLLSTEQKATVNYGKPSQKY